MRLQSSPAIGLSGQVLLPGDKSISHRAALFAALANGNSIITNFLDAGVTHALLAALSAIGVEWQLMAGTLTVHGRGLAGMHSPAGPLDCGNSATTLRLLAGALAAANVPAVLDGTAGLRLRPMTRLAVPLRAMGAEIETSPTGTAPLKLGPRLAQLRGMVHHLPVASAQVKSALLLAGLAASGPTTIHEPARSRDHSEKLLSQLGVAIQADSSGQSVTLTPQETVGLPPFELEIPGDFSSAAFLVVAALITPGSEITLQRVGLNPTRTGLLTALQAMGANIKIQATGEHFGEPYGTLVIRSSELRAADISGNNVVAMIDEFPAFAVAAAFATGESRVSGAGELRHKETDRIHQLCSGLANLGVNIKERPDGFIIIGQPRRAIPGGIVPSAGDHRLAMAYAILGLAGRGGVQVIQAEIINESFPEFATAFQQLGGRMAWIDA